MTSAQSTFEFCPNTEKKPFILLVGTIYIYLISKTYQDNDIQMIKMFKYIILRLYLQCW